MDPAGGTKTGCHRSSKLILGIDIGTTTVKVVITNEFGDFVASSSKETSAYVTVSSQDFREQSPDRIVTSLQECLTELGRYMPSVTVIGTCGQMHGVMLWKKYSGWRYTDPGGVEVRNASNLVTWEDGRCTQAFLDSLPKPQRCSSSAKCSAGSAQSSTCASAALRRPLSSGYGCATLLWLLRHQPSTLEDYDCAGTVMDYLVAALCNLDAPVMSDQNASSWGYWHMACSAAPSAWDADTLAAMCRLPTRFLPEVRAAGAVAGHLHRSLCGVPAGTAVLVGLGDMQCSVRATGKTRSDAVLNIGTSAQLSIEVSSMPINNDSVEVRPYFGGSLLAVAASLNGGNAISTFVNMVRDWMLDLGRIDSGSRGCIGESSPDRGGREPPPAPPEEELWAQLVTLGLRAPPSAIDLGGTRSPPVVMVSPLLLGERHSPAARGSVLGLGTTPLSLGAAFRAWCAGVVRNVLDMMGPELVRGDGGAAATRLICAGGALRRNAVLRDEVERQFAMPVAYAEPECTAALGAALEAALRLPST